MKKVKSCGILLFSSENFEEFLLMKHTKRFDIPKGHQKKRETDLATALREFEEETGVSRKDISLIDNFRFEYVYFPRYLKFHFLQVEKTLIVYLAHLKKKKEIKVSEHEDFEWVKWNPPHKIQDRTIDPLLSYTDMFFTLNRLNDHIKTKNIKL